MKCKKWRQQGQYTRVSTLCVPEDVDGVQPLANRERTTEGSDAYKKYVAKWLADEETVCVTDADFTRLQELFRFNGIPHYETITPDCRRVRDDLSINGYDKFDYELEQLKEKLK